MRRVYHAWKCNVCTHFTEIFTFFFWLFLRELETENTIKPLGRKFLKWCSPQQEIVLLHKSVRRRQVTSIGGTHTARRRKATANFAETFMSSKLILYEYSPCFALDIAPATTLPHGGNWFGIFRQSMFQTFAYKKKTSLKSRAKFKALHFGHYSSRSLSPRQMNS